MEEVEKIILLVTTVCTSSNWRQQYGFHQVQPALAKIAQWARLGFVAESRGYTLGKDENGAPDLIEQTKKPVSAVK